MLALLGWDPYLKNVVAVDSDVDITDDAQVLWPSRRTSSRTATCSSSTPARQPLDPSSSADGTTSRMGIDATRGSRFDGVRARVGDAAMQRAAHVIAQLGGASR